MLRSYGLLVVTCIILKLSRGYRLEQPIYHDDLYNYDNLIQKNDVKIHRQPDKKELDDQLSNLPKDGETFEGDIVMDSRLRDAVRGISKKSAVTEKGVTWPNGVLYYEVEPGFAGNDLLNKAIAEFEKRTCIRFQKRTNEPDYVIYSSKKDVCSSNIGRIGGGQIIHIGVHCHVMGTVEHETMHALGFIHEHSRPDRDQYLDVKWDNIKKEEWSNFNKYTFNDVDNENVDYNFASVMHYRNDAFTKNGKDTLIAKDEPDLTFGQRIKFSVGDIKEINELYKCKKYLINPNYHGLYKDYSGQKDTKAKKREKLRNLLRDRFYDSNSERTL